MRAETHTTWFRSKNVSCFSGVALKTLQPESWEISVIIANIEHATSQHTTEAKQFKHA